MKVELLDYMGSDLDIVDAARVSFNKAAEWCEHHDEITDKYWVELSPKDAKLIKYLADHNHWSPFSHCYLKFRIKAPIFVARQLQKHVVGLAWNEVSRRYVDSEPEFYEPTKWRKKADNVKQGSSEDAVDLDAIEQMEGETGAIYYPYEVAEKALETYNTLLSLGVCPEQARMVLPQSMMTEWIWSGSLYAFARVCKQRLDPHAQKETQEIAAGIHLHLKDLFPVSTEALIV